jgi:hypothetical protein
MNMLPKPSLFEVYLGFVGADMRHVAADTEGPVFLRRAGEVRISDHGYDELTDDQLTSREVVAGVLEAVVVEAYPNYPKGPSVLLLQKDRAGEPIHVVWSIPEGL